MTEQVNVSETTSQNQNVAYTQNVSTPTSAVTPKLYTDDEVNKIVGEKKQKAYEHGRQEALAQLPQQNVNNSVQQPTVNQQPAQNAQQQLTPEQEQKIAQQAAQMLRGEQAFENFKFKMNAGSQKYSDFDKVVSPLQINNIPDVVRLANGFDNTADIMYDLAKNPIKAANLTVLHQLSPVKAYEEMQNLSDSIKKNEAAKANQKDVREPLSPIKPSNVGAGSGKLSIAELRQQKNLKY